jgi:uncharacterized protein (TIGR00251 family)
MADFYQWDGEDLLLHVYLQPNAKKNEQVGIHDDQLKIRVTAPAIENKANKQLIKFLTKLFAVSASSITMLKGEHSRHKYLRISQPAKLPDKINPACQK